MNQPYMLGGVLPGNAHFDEGAATVFHGYDYSHSLSSEQVHARILLPRPVRILSLRPTEQPLAARVDPLGIMHRKRFPCVHVLRYTTGDLSKVQFYPHELEPGRGIHTIKGVKDPDDRLKQFKNIHIVAEPDGDAALDREHPAMGMEKIAELIEGLQGALAMDPLKVTKPSAEEGDFKKLGFVAIELLTLKEVLNLMEKAGKTWRNGDPFKPGDESEPVNFPPFSCDPVILRP